MDDDLNVEIWTDEQFSKGLAYISAQAVRFTGVITLAWLAAPYLAIWKAKATDEKQTTVWIITGQVPRDYVLDPSVTTPRDAIRTLGERWHAIAAAPGDHPLDRETIDMEPPAAASEQEPLFRQLQRQAEMLLNIADDESLWQEK